MTSPQTRSRMPRPCRMTDQLFLSMPFTCIIAFQPFLSTCPLEGSTLIGCSFDSDIRGKSCGGLLSLIPGFIPLPASRNSKIRFIHTLTKGSSYWGKRSCFCHIINVLASPNDVQYRQSNALAFYRVTNVELKLISKLPRALVHFVGTSFSCYSSVSVAWQIIYYVNLCSGNCRKNINGI